MVIINDQYWDSHGIYIKQAILSIYPEYQEENIINIPSYNEAKAYCASHQEVEAFIRSTTGVQSYVNDALSLYPRVLFFFPLGSNDFIHLNIFSQEEPPVIVTCGAGDEEGRNNTGYGNGLEFWDYDINQTQEPTPDQSSFSNGIILGKLLKIKHSLNCSWWEARWRARITADRNEPNRLTGPWDLYNGYGRINVERAINFKGYVPPDPYIQNNSPQSQIKGIIKNIETQYGIGNYSVVKAINLFDNRIWLSVEIYDSKEAKILGKKALETRYLKFNDIIISFSFSLYQLLLTHPLFQGGELDV